MPGMNTPTIGSDVLNELITDQAHMSKFEAFLHDQVTAGYTRQVERLSNLIDIVPLSSGVIAQNGTRSSKVATDAPTPKGNSKMDQIKFVCDEFRKAYPLSKVAGQSMSSFFQEVVDMLRDRAGVDVMTDVELEMLLIMRGLGSQANLTGSTVVDIAAAGSKWNNYVGATHDPWKNIMDLKRITGASEILIADDVALALMRSPIFTGASAGGGTEFIGQPKLVEILSGMGFTRALIGHQKVNGRPIELPPQIQHLHDGVVAMWSPGAIRQYVLEPYQYDSWVSEDDRKEYYRALKTCKILVPYSESVGVFTNVLA